MRGRHFLSTETAALYIANHQNLFDILATSHAFPSNTVTVGKRSLLFVPLFGILYWLSGNVLINRQDRQSAYKLLGRLTERIRLYNQSFWFFPEGTRSNGKGLLPFKQGPFRVAVEAQVPIVLICISNLHKTIKLGRWKNGEVILEVLPPIDPLSYRGLTPKELSERCHETMKRKLEALNMEIHKKGKRKSAECV